MIFLGLFSSPNGSSDEGAISNWLCACALSHCLNESVNLKEKLLRVQLALTTNVNEQAAVSLMQQCMNILVSSGNEMLLKFQTKISFLMFLATWLADCALAVDHFLAGQQNIPYVRI